MVARALADVPATDRPYVFTKCGMVWNPDDPAAEPARIGWPESIRRECEASLRRLRVERIDLLQMHWPADDGAVEDYVARKLCPKAEDCARSRRVVHAHGHALASASRCAHPASR